MKLLAVIDDKNNTKNKTKNLVEKNCKSKNVNIDFIDLSTLDDIDIKSLNKNKYDYVLAFGGDGTIIRAAKLALSLKLKIVGINIGNIGFLSSLQNINNFNDLLDLLKNKKYNVLKRAFLDLSVKKDNKTVLKSMALNDIILRNIVPGTMGKYQVSYDNNQKLINNFHADGLIVSTPTGSTAYSFSAGGPIIVPNAKCIMMTAICPHAFNNRSIVLDDSMDLTIVIQSQNQNLSIDGRNNINLSKNDMILIKKSKKNIEFIEFQNFNFFNNLLSRIKSI